MKLRGRFTLTLALAALVPITVAAVVTTRVTASRERERHTAERDEAKRRLERELGRLEQGVITAATSLAAHDHPLVAEMLIDYAKGNGDNQCRVAAVDPGVHTNAGKDSTITLTLYGDKNGKAPKDCK